VCGGPGTNGPLAYGRFAKSLPQSGRKLLVDLFITFMNTKSGCRSDFETFLKMLKRLLVTYKHTGQVFSLRLDPKRNGFVINGVK
jgi:hypothetical protein